MSLIYRSLSLRFSELLQGCPEMQRDAFTGGRDPGSMPQLDDLPHLPESAGLLAAPPKTSRPPTESLPARRQRAGFRLA